MTETTKDELTKLLQEWNLSDVDGPLNANGLADLVDDVARIVNKGTAAWLRDLADEVSSCLLCRVGLHRWRVTRVQSNRYGGIRTETCMRGTCPANRTESWW